MCFCDGYDFLITNKNSGEQHFIAGNENLGHYSGVITRGSLLVTVFIPPIAEKKHVRLNGTLYSISYNSHPECQRVKMELVKMLGVEDFELWKCPQEYIHLLNVEKTITL